MSYKRDMDFFNEDYQNHKNTVLNIIKVTVAVFAVVAVMLSVFLAVDIANGAGWDSGSNSGGASSNGASSIPVIKGPENNTIYVMLGDTVAYKSKVSVICDGEYTLEVIKNNVNPDEEGTYSVTYVATDSEGKSSRPYVLKVIVSKDNYTYDMLKGVLDKIASDLNISDSMTTAQKVRKIYEYANDPYKDKDDARIKFVNESNIPKMNPERRKQWQEDWIEEAYRTLKPLADGASQTQGDCYSYYSVSKAFFTYYGIEHKGIKKSDVGDSTHFWLMVNIGSSSNPNWYYYDATRLAGTFSDGGRHCCLRTLAEIKSYRGSESGENDMYIFDTAGLPTASTKKQDFNK